LQSRFAPDILRSMDLLTLSAQLADEVDALSFGGKVACVYNPLRYAALPHKNYVERFGRGSKKILFLGMNPGPWGMAQIGVPFGEIGAARDWLRVEDRVDKPATEHPKRPVEGFACTRSEVSGRRLWGLFSSRYTSPEEFFRDHYVANYCPLVFMEESGRNFTPDKLPKEEALPLYAACDRHLQGLIRLLRPRFLLGVGKFAYKRLIAAAEELPVELIRGVTIDSVLHPSPANPAANRGWSEAVEKKMHSIGAWTDTAG
jgi:single-strand selective monofunctional uracil DNA glycosylase